MPKMTNRERDRMWELWKDVTYRRKEVSDAQLREYERLRKRYMDEKENRKNEEKIRV